VQRWLVRGLRGCALAELKGLTELEMRPQGGGADDPSEMSLGPRTILIVENNELLKMCMVDLVEKAGLSVVQASNADEAMAVLELRSDIALMVTNVVMLGSMNGVELVHIVDGRWPSVKIIVASGKRGLSESDLPIKALFFAKPYHDEEIMFEIRALIS
jgi:two-component system, response regulator PdtaR